MDFEGHIEVCSVYDHVIGLFIAANDPLSDRGDGSSN